MQLKTIAFLIADSLKCQEKTLFFLPYLSSLSEVYKNKIIIKSEWEAQMKSYKLVDNVDKLFSKEGFADFYDISGSHGYQQISVHTIF